MKYSITFNSYHERELLCEKLAERCHTLCPMGSVLPCPFDDNILCDEITVEDWKNVFREVKE